MNIILVPGSRHGKGNNISLSARQVLLLVLVLGVFLPALVGVVAHQLQGMVAEQTDEIAMISAQKRELAAQRAAVNEARREAVTHLNALAQRMGQMQAQVLRPEVPTSAIACPFCTRSPTFTSAPLVCA